jgi:hypothetical protein
MRLAKFKNVGGDFVVIFQEEKKFMYENGDYVRISQWTDVEFAPVASSEVAEQIAALDAKEVATSAKRRAALVAMLPGVNELKDNAALANL